MKNITHALRFLRAVDIFYFRLAPFENPIKAHHTTFIYPEITLRVGEKTHKCQTDNKKVLHNKRAK